MQPSVRELLHIMESAKIHNQGRLGQLEQALTIWGEGDLSTATPLLLALDSAAADYRHCDAPVLYRGMLVRNPIEIAEQGVFEIISPAARSLASWSIDPEMVEEFMFGWERPWIMIEAATRELDLFIDLANFHEMAEPFQQMSHQGEVIVRMPAKLTIPADRFKLYTNDD